MLLRSKKCYIFKNIYLFLCLKVIFDTLGSFWLKNSSDFGKVQFCPELSNFSRFYPILATGEDFSTIVRLLYKPWYHTIPYHINHIFTSTILISNTETVISHSSANSNWHDLHCDTNINTEREAARTICLFVSRGKIISYLKIKLQTIVKVTLFLQCKKCLWRVFVLFGI